MAMCPPAVSVPRRPPTDRRVTSLIRTLSVLLLPGDSPPRDESTGVAVEPGDSAGEVRAGGPGTGREGGGTALMLAEAQSPGFDGQLFFNLTMGGITNHPLPREDDVGPPGVRALLPPPCVRTKVTPGSEWPCCSARRPIPRSARWSVEPNRGAREREG